MKHLLYGLRIVMEFAILLCNSGNLLAMDFELCFEGNLLDYFLSYVDFGPL
jgi:hypothetical protein